jgi:ankyrin repeat protein
MAFRGGNMRTQQTEAHRKAAHHAAHRERSPFGRGRVPPVTEVVRMLRSSDPLMFELNQVLLNAAEAGDTAKALVMLGLGAGIETRDFEGRTPLILAAEHLRRETAKVLLSRGADVNAANGIGLTALMLAAKNTDPIIFKLPPRRRPGARPKPECACKTVLMVEMLLRRGAKVNAMDAQRMTALDHAVANRNEDAIVLLRAYGAQEGAVLLSEHGART